MFVADSKGLATFRAHRANKKEIAILSKSVELSNPGKSPAECKALALEIRSAQKRDAQRNTPRKNKGRSHSAPTSSQRNVVVTKIKGIVR